jgi:SAM-dependent methyltransferase
VNLQQRFMRGVTTVCVRVPGAWRLFRGRVRANFDELAPEWDGIRITPERLVALRTALEAVPAVPTRVLDVGTGTGAAARVAADLWQGSQVTGVDLSPAMIDEARKLASSDREHYEVADSSELPFPDGSFELVQLNNMIPFFGELARLVAPGGHVAVAYSLGDRTPIYVPLDRVRRGLERRGLEHVADFAEGGGLALLAHRPERS